MHCLSKEEFHREWEVEGNIAEGSFGDVLLVHRITDEKQKAALKVIKRKKNILGREINLK